MKVSIYLIVCQENEEKKLWFAIGKIVLTKHSYKGHSKKIMINMWIVAKGMQCA